MTEADAVHITFLVSRWLSMVFLSFFDLGAGTPVQEKVEFLKQISFLVEEQWRGCCAFPRELAPQLILKAAYISSTFLNFFLAAGDRCDINLKNKGAIK